jgi:hypothetical protein
VKAPESVRRGFRIGNVLACPPTIPKIATPRDPNVGGGSTTVRAVTKAAHGTSGGLAQRLSLQPVPGCARRDSESLWESQGAQQRLPAEVRQQLLDGIYANQPFRTVLRDLGVTPNQVWGLTRTDEGWSTALEAALTASRRVDLQRYPCRVCGGCVCGECRSHQRVRMAKHPN